MLVGVVTGYSREALVKPEVVPPLHRNHVAEPLMRDLMHDRDRTIHDCSVRQCGQTLRAHHILREHDAPSTFHSCITDHRTQNQVKFAKRVRMAENDLVEVDRRLAYIEAKIDTLLVFLTSSCQQFDWELVVRTLTHNVVPYIECPEVRR